jgi:hypothetical protein
MRGRFNPEDGHLYACGMSAWGTTQMMRGGGLYRLRYTGKPIPLPIDLNAMESGIEIKFASSLDPSSVEEIDKYEVKTWDLMRSSNYGSDRYNKQELIISRAELQSNGKSVRLYLKDIRPVDVMTISYDIQDIFGNPIKGTIQNTIHNLSSEPGV